MLDFLLHFFLQLPLELFALLGSFTEEVFAPIPSYLVMATVGAAAEVQHWSLKGVMMLVILSAAGKTLGGWVLYYFADQIERFLIGKKGQIFGITHKDIQKIGRNLKKHSLDETLVFIFRVVPGMPSFLIAIAAGIFKFELKSYLLVTFVASVIRSAVYIAIGWYGWLTLYSWWEENQFISIALMGLSGLVLFVFLTKNIESYYQKFLK